MSYGSPESSDASNPVGGWREAVFCVADLRRWIEFWKTVGNWEVVHRGPVGEEWISTWGLPDSAKGEQALIGQPGQTDGRIRLISLSGVEQNLMRPGGQIWETGGWFDINVRIKDSNATTQAVYSQGWNASADPVEMMMGPVKVKEWLGKAPDGIVVAFIERVEPPLTDFPEFESVSRTFNASQIVKDADAVRHWYQDNLGFDLVLDTPGPGPGPDGGPNVFGFPHNVAADIPTRLNIMHPRSGNVGMIELIELPTINGRDFSAQTRMPNKGIVSLRFPVSNLAGLVETLEQKPGLNWVAPLAKREYAPYGDIDCCILRGENGEWIELFEAVS